MSYYTNDRSDYTIPKHWQDEPPGQDEPTPLDALTDVTDYDAWPRWAQTTRYALARSPGRARGSDRGPCDRPGNDA